MDDTAIRDLLTGSSTTQFLIGVFVLVFGTQKILSAENLEKSLGGLLVPVKWIHKKRAKAAEEEASVVVRLKKENRQASRELARYHAWSLTAAERIRSLEVFLAANGLESPPPPFIHFHEYEEDDEDDE